MRGSITGREALFPAAVTAVLLAFSPAARAADAPVFDYVNRYQEGVILSGQESADLHGTAVGSVRVMALTEKGFQPVPFQIDERLPDGSYASDAGKRPQKDDTPGVLDADDEIVFLARDAGFRAAKESWPSGAAKSAEIEVSDPLTGSTGYVYVFSFPSGGPRLSDRRYVSYDPAQDRITSDTFVVGFDRKKPLILEYGVFRRMNDNGRTEDVIDRLKVRIKAVTSAGVTISRNEDELDQEIVAIRSGPVRVIRSLELSVSLPPMPKVPITADFIFYPDYADIPVDFQIPGLINLFLKDMTVDVGVDFDKMKGVTFATLERPRGTYVDGQQPQAEREIPMGAEEWFMMQGRGLNTFVMFELDKELKKRKLKKEIHFTDSEDGSNPPESITGQLPEIGFQLSQWGGLEARKYHFEAKLHFLWDAPEKGGSGYYKSINNPLKASPGPGETAAVAVAFEQGDAAAEKFAGAIREKIGASALVQPVKSASRPQLQLRKPANVVVLAAPAPAPAIRSGVSRGGSLAVVAGEENKVLDNGVVSLGLSAGPRVLIGLVRQFFTGRLKAAVVTNGLSKAELKEFSDSAQRFSIDLVQAKTGPGGAIEDLPPDVSAVIVWAGREWTAEGGKAFTALLASAKSGTGPLPVFVNSRELAALGAAVGTEPNQEAGADAVAGLVSRMLKGEPAAQSEQSQFLKIYLNKDAVRSSKLLVPPSLIRIAETM